MPRLDVGGGAAVRTVPMTAEAAVQRILEVAPDAGDATIYPIDD